jgi:hypothetical protein
LTENQGDQIERIFAFGVIVFFGLFLKNTRVAHILKILIPKLEAVF